MSCEARQQGSELQRKTLTHGSLFSGIGGFDLGFERAGIETVWQVEIDDYCRRVLQHHFPSAQRYDDVRTVGKHNLAPVDILSGGFPCQDISNAGKRAGIDGERSGLWSEYARIIGELRPRFVVVENVAALLGRGMGRVLGDLAAIGYDAEWQSIRASDVGAPHRRERIWILAYSAGDLWGTSWDARPESFNGSNSVLADSISERRYVREDEKGNKHGRQQHALTAAQSGGNDMAHAYRQQSQEPHNGESAQRPYQSRCDVPYTQCCDGQRIFCGSYDSEEWQESRARQIGLLPRSGQSGTQWAIEPDVGRVAHGVPARVDRLTGLGNAIVPQIAEWIGRRIVEASA